MYETRFFDNNNPKSAYTHFEVSPKRADDETNADNEIEIWTDQHNPQFWGVYGRARFKGDNNPIGGRAEHIADFSTENKAVAFVRKLNGKSIEE